MTHPSTAQVKKDVYSFLMNENDNTKRPDFGNFTMSKN